ncbi:MAG: LuxR C-terminal-related transcriptional regulator [Acidimicrobiia bacterium]
MESGRLEEGRDAYRRNEWSKAYAVLSALDEVGELGPADLELLSDVKFMLGDVVGMIETLERAHHGYVERGEVLPAGRTAGWLGANYGIAGKAALASGWLERAQRLFDQVEEDCVERGYLLLPSAIRKIGEGDLNSAVALAADAARIGTRFGDADLVALAGHLQGRALIHQGSTQEAIRVFDEIMISVTAGRLAPRITGVVYCGVVECCFLIHDIGRAAEWTGALSGWVDSQPDLVAFTDQCLAHRSEILRLGGTWDQAIKEAKLAHVHDARGLGAAVAAYQLAEIHRLRGELDLAEEAYREAGLRGQEPQPGLALLRASQGNLDAAVASITRAVAESSSPAERAMLRAAQIEVLTQQGDLLGAEAAVEELSAIAEQTGIDMHLAWAAAGRATVALARSEPDAALPELRDAMRRWQDLNVPYEVGRSRSSLGVALGAIGDGEAADIEFQAAREIFVELGAEPDVRRIDDLRRGARPDKPHGLTPRELEVLRLLTSGASNRSIATDLVLSERTIDRHVSNIFTKIGVSSRSAATAFAIRNQLG